MRSFIDKRKMTKKDIFITIVVMLAVFVMPVCLFAVKVNVQCNDAVSIEIRNPITRTISQTQCDWVHGDKTASLILPNIFSNVSCELKNHKIEPAIDFGPNKYVCPHSLDLEPFAWDRQMTKRHQDDLIIKYHIVSKEQLGGYPLVRLMVTNKSNDHIIISTIEVTNYDFNSPVKNDQNPKPFWFYPQRDYVWDIRFTNDRPSHDLVQLRTPYMIAALDTVVFDLRFISKTIQYENEVRNVSYFNPCEYYRKTPISIQFASQNELIFPPSDVFDLCADAPIY